MDNILHVRSAIEHKDGKDYIHEIRAVGYTDDSGKFHMTRCAGKILACSNAPPDKITKMDRSVA